MSLGKAHPGIMGFLLSLLNNVPFRQVILVLSKRIKDKVLAVVIDSESAWYSKYLYNTYSALYYSWIILGILVLFLLYLDSDSIESNSYVLFFSKWSRKLITVLSMLGLNKYLLNWIQDILSVLCMGNRRNTSQGFTSKEITDLLERWNTHKTIWRWCFFKSSIARLTSTNKVFYKWLKC